MQLPIYLDGFATMPIAPEVRAAMLDALDGPGNASSPHYAGEKAASLISAARGDVAALIGAAPNEVIFTSGATEANNLALLGLARAARASGNQRRTILVSAIEHKAVLEPARALEREGFALSVAPVDCFGRVDLKAFGELLSEDVLIASLMAVNNETGVIQPIAEAVTRTHDVGALFHCDAAQAAGKIEIDTCQLGVDYLSLSAHKMYGPMGVGALYVSATAPRLAPLYFGGGQHQGLRPGTEPVALIAGFGAAARVATVRLQVDSSRCAALAGRLLDALLLRQTRVIRITDGHSVLPGSLALSFSGIDAEDLCLKLSRSVQLSTGSACTSGQLKMSHVLEAMGFSDDNARSVLRLFCHRYLSDNDVDCAAALIAEATQTAVATGRPLQ